MSVAQRIVTRSIAYLRQCSSTDVFPVFTTCFSPHMAAAGFIGTIWPVISQSNSALSRPTRLALRITGERAVNGHSGPRRA